MQIKQAWKEHGAKGGDLENYIKIYIKQKHIWRHNHSAVVVCSPRCGVSAALLRSDEYIWIYHVCNVSKQDGENCVLSLRSPPNADKKKKNLKSIVCLIQRQDFCQILPNLLRWLSSVVRLCPYGRRKQGKRRIVNHNRIILQRVLKVAIRAA